MNKAFTKEDDAPQQPEFRSRFQPLQPGFRNLITPRGQEDLRDELADLLARQASAPEPERALLKLRAADLAKRLETHEVVPPHELPPDRVIFGTTVLVRDDDGNERRYTLVGIDEARPEDGRISWTSPLARALLNQRVGALAKVHTPNGETELEIVSIGIGQA